MVELGAIAPMQTLLDYLRLEEKSRGTKEGCNEGDCGACTVALGTLRNGQLVYEPVNACILLLGQIDGKELVTVEDLAAATACCIRCSRRWSTAMPRNAASARPASSWRCSPSISRAIAPTRQQIVDQIAGNLCRCTGYRPIIDAALASLHRSGARHVGDGCRTRRRERFGALNDDDGSVCRQ